MRKPFAPIGCAIQTHVKPNDRLSWDTRSEPGFNLGTLMEHHRCFRVYVTRTRATRISDTVFFKHQYITNPAISPESHVVAAAQQLATALKGNIPAGNETAEALTKVSKLFTKIAAAKQAAAAAKEQRNRLRANPAARITTHLPRVGVPHPRVDVPSPRVAEPPQAVSHSRAPRVDVQSSAARPNYISQDEEDNNDPPPATNNTLSHPKHYARGNVRVHRHLPTGVHCLGGPRPTQFCVDAAKSHTELQSNAAPNVDAPPTNDVVLRNGQSGHWRRG